MINLPSPIPRLADGVGIACFAGNVVVLDIHRDGYSRVSGGAAVLLAAIRDGIPFNSGDPMIEALRTNGLVTMAPRGPTPWLAVAEIVRLEASALEGGDPPRTPAIRDLAVVSACSRSRFDLRRHQLAKILSNLPTRSRNRTMIELLALARDFDRARRLAPFKPRCLPDTLAFLRYARSRGYSVQLVFGVKCHPFEAHCWAQSGGLVLTDPLERIRRFQPILAV